VATNRRSTLVPSQGGFFVSAQVELGDLVFDGVAETAWSKSNMKGPRRKGIRSLLAD
jgi:hypothetical protein